MKFDFCIGNPPYQEEAVGDNDTYTPPVYDKFMDSAFEIADKVELIHPARFLFNAGSTPKPWNKKMLQDDHFKVLHYEQDCRKIFPIANIEGGVAITYHDKFNVFGAIDTFTSFDELNTLMSKVVNYKNFVSLSDIVITRTAYRMTDKMHKDFPNAINQLSDGHPYDVTTNVFERLPEIFVSKKPNDGHQYLKILGRENNERTYKYVRRDYINSVINLDKYKVFVPSAHGSGAIGKSESTPLIGPPVIGEPFVGNTESFISIGKFDNLAEDEHLLKYIKSKFARTLLGILKITQHVTPEKWKFVPMQDFTDKSDIDWSKSVKEIDQQLYRKYGLTQDEIGFIESKVKEME